MHPFRLAFPFLGLTLAACASLGPFHDVDANHDGRISREEAVRQSEDLADLFDAADDDRDGALDEEEYELARGVILRTRGSQPPGSHDSGGHKH